MSKTNKQNAGAPKSDKAPKAPRKSKGRAPAGALALTHDGASDALGGRLMCRTSVIHSILVALYNEGADKTMSTGAITNAINAQWARATEGGRPTTNAATASHLNTLKKKQLVEHGADGRGWRLSNEGAKKLAGAQ